MALLLILLGLIVSGAIFWQPIYDLASSPDKIRALVEGAGFWGPVIFVAVQFLQVLVAPIPGQVAGVLAGALFGAFWGTFYSMLGALIGFTTIFFISRKLGRPFVERFVKKEHLDKFDYLAKANGPMVFFLIFLLPVFPDDIICYIAGLSAIRIRTLVVISLAGRFPGYLVLSLVGAGMAQSDVKLVVGVASVAILVVAIGFWRRKQLEAFIKRLGEYKKN